MKNTTSTKQRRETKKAEKIKTFSKGRREQIRNYLINLIEEKGVEIEATINIDGHIGLTWLMLIDFIDTVPEYHDEIRKTLVSIDFQNGDVFHYLKHLATGMVKSLGH